MMSANSFVLKGGFNGLLVAATMVAVGLIVGVLVIMPMAGTQPAAVVADVEDSIQRAREAAAARYAAMDAFYGATTGDNLQRSREASAARYAAMGAFYAAREAANIRRGVDASVARYAAMGEYYAAAK
jgi:uncharacterized membrane protein